MTDSSSKPSRFNIPRPVIPEESPDTTRGHDESEPRQAEEAAAVDDRAQTAPSRPARRTSVKVAQRPSDPGPLGDDSGPRRSIRSGGQPASAEGEGKNALGIDYRLDPAMLTEPREKDAGMRVSKGFKRTLAHARTLWSSENFDALDHDPTLQAFQEGLMRVGLKHIDDPELMDLIPPDLRRK